jgi:cellulose biosynthesis protein BcsQ
MIITLLNTKGGVGKSSSVVALAGAVAAQNSENENQIKVCLVDADEQGTVNLFFDHRAAKGMPSYSIDLVRLEPERGSTERLLDLDDQYDYVIVDLPGNYNDELALFAMESDLIVVPVGLTKTEVRPAYLLMHQINDLIEKYDLPTTLAIMVTRGASIYQFEPSAGKSIFQELINKGYPILNANMPQENAFRLSMDSGLYTFELEQMDRSQSASKSPARAKASADKAWDACINKKITIKDLEEFEDVQD